jgi:hypothetical protein
MTKNLHYLFLVAVLCFVLIGASATAESLGKIVKEKRYEDQRVRNIQQYNIQPSDRELTARKRLPDNLDELRADRTARRISLGAVSPTGVASPGLSIKQTYDDWQWNNTPAGRLEWYENDDSATVNFAYGVRDGAQETTPDGMGANYYKPINGGDWPRGIGTGCRVQSSDEAGWWPNMGVAPNGTVVLAGNTEASSTIPYGAHQIFQSNSRYSCFFGGSILQPDQYGDGFIDSTTEMTYPQVTVEQVGTDTVVHLIAGERYFYYVSGTGGPDAAVAPVSLSPIQYFRKINGGPINALTTWEGPITLDTASSRGVLASTPTGKVAVSYLDLTAWAVPEQNGYDQDVFYRESTDTGATWAPRVNITNYDRTQKSYAPWLEHFSFYDSEDELHILWNGNPYPADVYDSSDFFFVDFTTSLFHWTTRTNTISRVANRDYGLEWNTVVCGFGGYNALYLGFYSMAECNDRLYVVYSGWNDVYADPPIIDDCASSPGSAGDRGFQANGELYMHVSTTLDGLLWDAPRNITNTYTPECDSAGFGGVCMNDTKATLAPSAYDSAGWGQDLTFPGAERVVVDPGYTGSKYLMLMYLEDHYPGNADVGAGDWTSNDLKWMRIGCIDPVTAAQVAYTPTRAGYPQYTTHGTADTITVEVINDGNTDLYVGIDTTKIAPPVDWLGISTDTLEVGAGANNTATFDVYINDGGIINSPGTIVALNGIVYMRTNADPPRDSVEFTIEDYLVADTVVGLEFDTLSTMASSGSPQPIDYVELIAASHGNMGYNGNSGNGGLNLDYVSDDTLLTGDCDNSASVYLYAGSPYLVQNDAGTYHMSYSVFQQSFANDLSFRPVPDFASPQKIDNANYEAFFTGTFVNWDTTIAVEKTIYAPKTNAKYMIQKFNVFALDNQAHSNLGIGEIIDWDIPSSVGSNNNSFVSNAAKTVYFQGTDDPEDTGRCQDNVNRYGAQALLGMYSSSELQSDNCVNNLDFYGVIGQEQTKLLFVDDSLLAESLWVQSGANTGLNAAAPDADLHGVFTFEHDITLPSTDTLTYWSVITTVRNGSEDSLVANIQEAQDWYTVNLRPGCDNLFGCCVGSTGNVDGDASDLVDVGDLTALIAYLYIPPNPVPICFEEANIDGDTGGLVDVGDLTALIAFLYIPPNPPTAPCQ